MQPTGVVAPLLLTSIYMYSHESHPISIVILVMVSHCQPHSKAVPLVPQTTDSTNTPDSEPVTAHPGHPHHLPCCFCNPTPSIVDELIFSKAPETFNLTDISENDEDDDEPPIPRAQGNVLMNTTRSAAPDPLLTDTQTNSPGSSADVHFFFTKIKGEDSVCKPCRCVYLLERFWTYLPRTVNANLCNHIVNHHLDTYLDEAEKNRWQIILKCMKNAFTNGYTFTTLCEMLHQPGVTMCSLPPIATTDSNHSQPSFPSTPPLTSLKAGLPPFS